VGGLGSSEARDPHRDEPPDRDGATGNRPDMWGNGELHGTTIFWALCREQVEQVLSTSTLTGNDFAQALGWGGRTDMAHIRKAFALSEVLSGCNGQS